MNGVKDAEQIYQNERTKDETMIKTTMAAHGSYEDVTIGADVGTSGMWIRAQDEKSDLQLFPTIEQAKQIRDKINEWLNEEVTG